MCVIPSAADIREEHSLEEGIYWHGEGKLHQCGLILLVRGQEGGDRREGRSGWSRVLKRLKFIGKCCCCCCCFGLQDSRERLLDTLGLGWGKGEEEEGGRRRSGGDGSGCRHHGLDCGSVRVSSGCMYEEKRWMSQ